MEEKEITSAFSIQDMLTKTHSSLSEDSEVTAFSWLAAGIHSTMPLRCDDFIISICTGGKARIGIDMEEHKIYKDCMVILQPGNYIVTFDHDNETAFSTMACTLATIESLMPQFPDIYHLMLRYRFSPVMQLSSDEARQILGFIKFIKSKTVAAPTPFQGLKLKCALQTALFELLDIHTTRLTEQASLFGSRKEELMAAFMQGVAQNFRNEREVAFYAEQLGVSPKHLTFVVKTVSGMTPGRWIDNYVVLESKILMRNLDLSIQQIAARLNFANQSFFGKYFKKITGMSPSEFRRNLASTDDCAHII